MERTRPWHPPFEPAPLSYAEALAKAHDIGFSGNTGDPLLETVVEMLDELERPDGSFDIIQIAGTNGKTSTARYTAAILSGEGVRCALYTSPELVEMTERMELDGAPVSRGLFARGIALAAGAAERVNERREAKALAPYRVTPFDLLTVAALCIFAEAQAEVAVLEVGLGGRWDATTATHPTLTCVTGIGLDHMHILGDTLEEIAREKAAVIKAGQSCVLGVGTATPPSVEDVFLERCRGEGVEPVLVRPSRARDAEGELERGEMRRHPNMPKATYRVVHEPGALADALVLDVETPRARYGGLKALKPAYQAANIACALELAEAYLMRPLDAARLARSVERCPTPGRFAVLQDHPLQLVDAAHNPQSIRAFLASLGAFSPQGGTAPVAAGEESVLLCAVLADKDVAGIAALLAAAFPCVAVCQTASPRALPAPELARLFARAGREPQALYTSVGEACCALRDKSFIACGSITLAGEVVSALRHPDGPPSS